MRERFEAAPGADPRAIYSEEELRALLDRIDSLHRSADEIRTVQHPLTTVEDIAEALGLDPDFVASELCELHREQKEARLVGVLKELEEPLYRVERPSPVQPPMSNPLFRLQAVRHLMDKAKEEPRLVRRSSQPTEHDRHSQEVGRWIIIALAALFVFVLVFGLVNLIAHGV